MLVCGWEPQGLHDRFPKRQAGERGRRTDVIGRGRGFRVIFASLQDLSTMPYRGVLLIARRAADLCYENRIHKSIARCFQADVARPETRPPRATRSTSFRRDVSKAIASSRQPPQAQSTQ